MTFDELNKLVADRYLESVVQKKTRAEVEEDMEDFFFEFLVDAYVSGLYEPELGIFPDYSADRAIELLNADVGEDHKTYVERLREHVRNGELPKLLVLADTEYHRMYETGKFDCATQAKAQGRTVLKHWHNMGDEKVRLTHIYLGGVSVPLDEYFYTIDGDYGRFPGDFQMADNNCNCRCSISYSATRNGGRNRR